MHTDSAVAAPLRRAFSPQIIQVLLAVIVGKSILSFQEDEEDHTPSLKRFGFVQTYEAFR
jgi:hypothetical protein